MHPMLVTPIPQPVSVGSVYSTPLTSKMYDFVLAVDASGNSIVTSVREYTHGIWRNELIELGETYSVVSVNDAGDEYCHPKNC